MPDRAPQSVDRQLPTDEARDLISLVRDIALAAGRIVSIGKSRTIGWTRAE